MVNVLLSAAAALFGCHNGHCPIRPPHPVIVAPSVVIVPSCGQGHYDYVSETVLQPGHFESYVTPDGLTQITWIKPRYVTRVSRVWVSD